MVLKLDGISGWYEVAHGSNNVVIGLAHLTARPQGGSFVGSSLLPGVLPLFPLTLASHPQSDLLTRVLVGEVQLITITTFTIYFVKPSPKPLSPGQDLCYPRRVEQLSELM